MLNAGVLISLLTIHAPVLTAKDYEIKAVYLYNLGSFITWPKTAFKDESFKICILGQDPFKQRLEAIAQGHKITGYPVTIKHLTTVEEASGCQMLFISESEQLQLPTIFEWLQGKPILTVSDIPNFITRGGMLQFFPRQNKIRLALTSEIISGVGLKVSAHLLRIIEQIPASNK